MSIRFVFGIMAVAAATQSPASAQQPNDPVAAARRSLAEVTGYVTRAAALVPADKYDYKPTASVRTFGQLIAHIADSHNWYCARATGRNVQWADPIEKTVTGKAALGERLKQSIDACKPAYAATSQFGPLIDNIGHTNLHYGNIVTYLRMMGLVPPSS